MTIDGPENVSAAVPDAQQRHWEQTYTDKPAMYGAEPSVPATVAIPLFNEQGVTSILELGGGHGRDTLVLAGSGFKVTVLDYSRSGIEAIEENAAKRNVSSSIIAIQHDVKQPLPVPDGAFDACYSHMLFNMALSTTELTALTQEVWRVLRPGGLHIYSVRNTRDPQYGVGAHHGENRFETGGFEVHFFDRAKVDQLAHGFRLLDVLEFEEGTLPRRLYCVSLQKPTLGEID